VREGLCKNCSQLGPGVTYPCIAGLNLNVATTYWSNGALHSRKTTLGNFRHFDAFICNGCRRRCYLLLIGLPFGVLLLAGLYFWWLIHFHADETRSFELWQVLLIAVPGMIASGLAPFLMINLLVEFIYPRHELMNRLACKALRKDVEAAFVENIGPRQGEVTLFTPYEYRRLKSIA
jgi:hypothetical protein